MAQAFSLLLSLSISYCPPYSSLLAFSPAISLTYTGLSLLPLCGKCNPNHSRSATVGICPSLSYHDGLDEVGGGGHTDWECLRACVCAQSVRQPDVQSVSQSVSQRSLMPFVVCCGCGGDKRLTVRFYHLVSVCVRGVSECVEIKMQQIWVYEGSYKYLWNETTHSQYFVLIPIIRPKKCPSNTYTFDKLWK